MSSYSVVHFFDDDSVETVPSSWVNKDGTHCAWPKNINQASKLIDRKTVKVYLMNVILIILNQEFLKQILVK